MEIYCKTCVYKKTPKKLYGIAIHLAFHQEQGVGYDHDTLVRGSIDSSTNSDAAEV